MSVPIPSWQLYGEESPFPDLLHVERIVDRAAGLDWHIAPHRHLQLHQVFLLKAGQMRVTMDGVTQNHHAVVVNIPRGVVHGFDFSAGAQGFVVSLPAADFPELFAAPAEPLAPLSRPFALPATGGFDALFATLAAAHREAQPYRALRLRAAAITLACAVAAAAPDAPAPLTDPRIAQFEALIRRELASGWALPDYARALSLSERQLRRLCVQATGLSAHDFAESLRLREACRMLAYTRMQVQEVGFALGHDDPAYFTRVFRRGMGISPLAYRQRLDPGA